MASLVEFAEYNYDEARSRHTHAPLQGGEDLATPSRIYEWACSRPSTDAYTILFHTALEMQVFDALRQKFQQITDALNNAQDPRGDAHITHPPTRQRFPLAERRTHRRTADDDDDDAGSMASTSTAGSGKRKRKGVQVLPTLNGRPVQLSLDAWQSGIPDPKRHKKPPVTEANRFVAAVLHSPLQTGQAQLADGRRPSETPY